MRALKDAKAFAVLILAVCAIICSYTLPAPAGSSGAAGGDTLNEATTQLKWNTGLGAINHVQGPTDQPLVVTAGAARALTLGAADGQNVNVQGLVTMASGQGAIAHVTGPDDQNFIIQPGAAYSLVLRGNGDTYGAFAISDAGVVTLGGDSSTSVAINDPVTFQTGMGAVNQLVGPSDQPFVVTAGAARGLTLGAASGQTLSLATGNVSIGDTVTSYGGTATAGRGLAHIVAYGSSTGVDGTTFATYTTGGAAEALEVGGSLICTAISSGSVEIELTYTAGGTVRTHDAFGTVITTLGVNSINSIGGPGDLKLYTLAIAADAATAVTWKVSRSGTNTATWYGWIKRIN